MVIRRIAFLAVLLLASNPALRADLGPPPDPRFVGAAKARIDSQYAIVVFESGSRAMYPLSGLTDADKNWLTALASEHPLAHGNSKVVVAAAEAKPAKKTIEISKTDGTLETVQLCQPGIIRNQDGNFCYTFATVHCMDIAGYVIAPGTIEAIEGHANAINAEDPWKDRDYPQAVERMVMKLVPPEMVHHYDHRDTVYDWIRQEVRKGHPVLTLLPDNIWQALPPEMVAKMQGWHGDSSGHAVVINGFTFDHKVNRGTFHIVNSWDILQQWDLSTEAAAGFVDVYYSLSPKGEVPEKVGPITILSVSDLGLRGSIHIFAITTSEGVKRVAANSEAEARAMVLSH